MGDMGDYFKDYNEWKSEERAKKEQARFQYAADKLLVAKYQYHRHADRIIIYLGQGTITFYPFTGWFQGQKPYGHIKGRGIKNLISALAKVRFNLLWEHPVKVS